jgi:signal transduction histidine kinase
MSAVVNTQPVASRKRLRAVRGNATHQGIVSTECQRERGELAVQKMCVLGEMTAGIAHDFRNILCIVTSGLRVAKRSANEPAKLKSALTAIHAGIERGERMVARLLSFASQQELPAHPEDLNTLLRKLEPLLRDGAGSGVRITLAFAANLPACVVDPPRFNAAILNLVVNARDAMPKGGQIRISTTAVQGMQFGSPRCYVRVRVRDHGVGMPSDVMDRIFEPYFTTKGDRGTGLGVPQVDALMERVGGFVRVDSTVGRGTTFDLFFPAQDEVPTTGDTWQELDTWANEGGAIVGEMAPAYIVQRGVA